MVITLIVFTVVATIFSLLMCGLVNGSFKSKKKEEIYSPVLKQAEEAIKSVAKENGYSYILDTSAGAVLYSQDSDNIAPLVKKKLGLSAATAAPVPGK